MTQPGPTSAESVSERFEILSRLGEGAMGVVHAAHDRARDKRVALKTMQRVSPKGLYRFKREFRSLSELSHPNIVEFYELIHEGDDWLFSMELVEGRDLLTHVMAGAKSAPTTTDGAAAPTAAVRVPSLPVSIGSLDDSEAGTVLDDSHDLRGEANAPSFATTPTRPALARPKVSEIVDVASLRDCLGQLARALCALHQAGIVHRDLKPSNVMVSREGRVVLMDFGVVAELSLETGKGNQGVMGTPAFMAPEQGLGRPPSAAADWYAFGVIMYRALTGLMPFRGPTLQLLTIKRERDPTPITELVTELPADLGDLCMRLLTRRPSERPSGDEVLEALGVVERSGGSGPGLGAGLGPGLEQDTIFVGRSTQLERLHELYAEVEAGAPRLVEVRGPAGIGKTSLVRQALEQIGGARPDHDDIDAEQSGPFVLSARCHERETMPYKAFDEVLDSLCLYLHGLDGVSRKRLIPEGFDDLARLFPVLNRVLDSRSNTRNPNEARARACVALRELLTRLGSERPVILHIEDLQWADADSVPLLAALFESSAQARRLMIVATLRVDESDTLHVRAGGLDDLLDDLGKRGLGHRLQLGPLDPTDQRELIQKLSDSGINSETIDVIVREASGHPLLLAELTRALADAGDGVDASADLESLIWRRVEGLDPAERRLLEHTSVAAKPFPARILCTAAGVQGDRERAVRRLALARLVQVARSTQDPWIDVYQDKIRDAVLERLSPESTRACSVQLATELERWGEAAPASLARLWQSAGVIDKAARYYLEAGHEAATQLAFDRARMLYGQASELAESGDLGDEGVRVASEAWAGLATIERSTGASDELIARGRALLEDNAADAERWVMEFARVNYLLGCLLYPRGDLVGCAKHHTAAMELAEASRSYELMARAHGGLGDVEFMRGRMRSCDEHCREAIALGRAHGLTEVVAANLSLAASSRLYDGDLRGVKRYVHRAIELTTKLGDMRGKTVALCIGTWRHIQRGHFDVARTWNQRFLEMIEALSMSYFRPIVELNRAELARIIGRRQEAAEIAEAGLENALATNYWFMLGALYGVHAWATQDPAKRHAAIEAGLEHLSKTSFAHDHMQFYRLAIEASLDAGEYERVEDLVARLEKFIEPQPAGWSVLIIDRARALVAYARNPRDRMILANIARLHAKALDLGFVVLAEALSLLDVPLATTGNQ